MLLNNINPKNGRNKQPRKGLKLLVCLRNMLKEIAHTHTSETTKSFGKVFSETSSPTCWRKPRPETRPLTVVRSKVSERTSMTTLV